ncbi:MAG: histidine phosphatase family protein [Chloroflexi bacterium]|nr:histidine phosphatase family protein [Chloroflexota bacterium]
MQIVFETHSISEDNERGIATGWLPGRLSPRGRELARQLGVRRHDDGLAAVFCSDLTRASETAAIAFADTSTPIFLDWRLRECNYGDRNGMPAHLLHTEREVHIDTPYPNGESWRSALARVVGALPDLWSRWPESRVLLIGHVATRWALDQALMGARLEDLARTDFAWQPGWEYEWDGRPLTD